MSKSKNVILKCDKGLLSQMLTEDDQLKLIINDNQPMVFTSEIAAKKMITYLEANTNVKFKMEDFNEK